MAQRDSKLKTEVQDCTFKPQMVTNSNLPIVGDELAQQLTPNAIVLGEMTMTTNNTDEEGKINFQNQRDLRETSQVIVEDRGSLDTS